MIESVASHLSAHALSHSSSDERDCFGRFAFNRYYYASFLMVKAELGIMRKEWNELPHASIPELLTGQILTGLKRGLKTAQRSSDVELIAQCSQAIAAAKELADLLNKGKAVRLTADYFPNIPVDFFSAHGFKLNSVTIEEAKTWPFKSKSYIDKIQFAWKQINV